MKLKQDTVREIAHLARLCVAENELDQYCTDLSNILDLVEKMDSVATDDVQAMTHPFDASLRLREDAVTETDQRDRYQTLAPAAEKGLYLVPKVIE